MKNIAFLLFPKKEKEALMEIYNKHKDKYRFWSTMNIFIPFILYIVPLLFVSSFLYFEMSGFDLKRIIQISVNGNLPLISVMVLISLTTFNYSKTYKSTESKNISSKAKNYALLLSALAVCLYIVENIIDCSKGYIFLSVLSILILFFSQLVGTIYFMLSRKSIEDTIQEVTDKIRVELSTAAVRGRRKKINGESDLLNLF